MEVSLIFASLFDNAIGFRSSGQGFRGEKDMQHYARITKYTPNDSRNIMIVGRKTWDIMPKSVRNSPQRFYIVLSRNDTFVDLSAPTPNNSPASTMIPNFRNVDDNCVFVSSWSDVDAYCKKIRGTYYKIFVIGGEQIYRLALQNAYVSEIFHSGFDLLLKFDDAVLLSIDYSNYRITDQSTSIDKVTINDTEIGMFPVTFTRYESKIAPFEYQYQTLIRRIQTEGVMKSTRGTVTRALNHACIHIDLNQGFPLITLRKSFFRGIVEELLWMMRGETDVQILKDKNIHIWDGNSSRAYLDRVGLNHLNENDIGPGYGFQFRYSGAEYIDCKNDYSGRGIDQLQKCIDLLKNDPDSRRIIINLWNTKDVSSMALPPCPMIYQFTVHNNKISCHLYQRSWDILLGWNTSTAALLTHILAHYCDMGVGTLTHTICDVHYYEQHQGSLDQLLERTPYSLPKLIMTDKKIKKIEDYDISHFNIEGYQCHDPIKMEMIAGSK